VGIVFVLIFWAVVWLILAGLGAGGCGLLAAVLTRRVTKGRRQVILAAALFPFASLIWAGAVFVFQAVVNESVLNRDLGLGDTWHAPLPNGYQIMMIDVTDQGWIYNPKTQRLPGVIDQEDAIPDVRQLQITPHHIAGAAEKDHYFILNTRSGKRMDFKTFQNFRQAAHRFGFEPHLEPIYLVYSRFRFGWFDVFAGLLLILPIVAGALLLILRIWRLRSQASPAFL
jgi:hypothetical protein